MLDPTPLPDGELFLASDRLLLVDHIESAAVAGGSFTRPGYEAAVHVTVAGRINNTDERADLTFAIPPASAVALMDMLAHSLRAITAAGISE
jgi:hypothetical protein